MRRGDLLWLGFLLLVPFSAEQMEAYSVIRLVNDPGNDAPECIQSIEMEDWLPGLSS